jgi:CheY-like chemotaxis protein
MIVVDDSPTDRQIVTMLLQKQGYEVTTAIESVEPPKVAIARLCHPS